MWIAKNSITGKTYGKKYSSIYNCQDFINKELTVLEYEMEKCFALEKQVEDDIKHSGKSIIELMKDSLDTFAIESGLREDIECVVNLSLQGKKQEEIDKALLKLSNARWQKNKIIRCWYVEQKRFATGFDF